MAEPSPPANPGSSSSETSGAVAPAPPSSLFERAAKRLKDLKEVVAAIVFFAVGLGWIVGYFATKSQLGQLRCLMQAQIDLVSSQNDFNVVRLEMINVNVQLEDLKTRKDRQGSLNLAETQQFFELQARLDDLKKQRAAAQEKSDRVKTDLAQNKCANP